MDRGVLGRVLMEKTIQLSFPGIRNLKINTPVMGSRGLNLGQKVVYLGTVNGGPTTGTLGIVKQTYARKAVIDMGRLGTWNVPYYFLAHPASAA